MRLMIVLTVGPTLALLGGAGLVFVVLVASESCGR